HAQGRRHPRVAIVALTRLRVLPLRRCGGTFFWNKGGAAPFYRTAQRGEFPMAKKEPKQLEDLFEDALKDIYFAEKKILVALPKMAKAAQNEQLKAAFEKHE